MPNKDRAVRLRTAQCKGLTGIVVRHTSFFFWIKLDHPHPKGPEILVAFGEFDFI